MKTPSDKQIEFADEIADVLGIDFPTSSKDFTAQTYWNFVNEHLIEYQNIIAEGEDPSDYDFYGYENDVWCEHY